MQPSVREYFSSYTDAEYLLMFVAAEVKIYYVYYLFYEKKFLFLQHVLLALRFVISFAIPSTPNEIEIAKMKHLYESNQALRNEVRKIHDQIGLLNTQMLVFLYSANDEY